MAQALRVFMVIVVSGSIVLSGGCSSATKRSKQQIARFEIDANFASTRPASQPSAMSRVQYAGRYSAVARTGFRTVRLRDTEIALDAGDQVGFRRNDDGTMTALALHSEFNVGKPSRNLKYLAWQPIKLQQTKPDTALTRTASVGMGILTFVGFIGFIFLYPLLLVADHNINRK